MSPMKNLEEQIEYIKGQVEFSDEEDDMDDFDFFTAVLYSLKQLKLLRDDS